MSIRKRKRGWIIDVDVGLPDGTRKRVRKVCPLNGKRDAEAMEREIKRALLAGTYKARKEVLKENDSPPTLCEFAEKFIEDYAKANNKASEVITKQSILKNHLQPAFGNIRLDRIGMREVDRYKNRKKQEGQSLKTINNHLAVLHKLLVVAHEYSEIDKVPKIKWQKFPAPDFDFLSFDEAKALVNHAEDFWREMILVALNTGMRHGELLELREKDISLHNAKLVVSRAYYRGIVDTPKNGKSREIWLNDELVAVFENLLKGKPNRLIFGNEKGHHLNSEQCKWPIWRACDKAEIRRVRWHVLRHTFASHLTMLGVPLKVVQELLGHFSVQMTMRYSHLSPESKKNAVNQLQIYGNIAATKNGELDNSPFLQ